MVRKIVIAFFCWLLFVLFLYSLFAFTNWQSNPFRWDIAVRGGVAFLSFGAFVFFVVYVMEGEDK